MLNVLCKYVKEDNIVWFVLQSSALLGEVNCLHSAFPEDVNEEYKRQGQVIHFCFYSSILFICLSIIHVCLIWIPFLEELILEQLQLHHLKQPNQPNQPHSQTPIIHSGTPKYQSQSHGTTANETNTMKNISNDSTHLSTSCFSVDSKDMFDEDFEF